MAWSCPWNYLGMIVSGDVGGYTIYTDRFGKKVIYPASPPKCPSTPNQLLQRLRFRLAQADYMSQPAAVKLAWETIPKRASLCATGQNLWLHFALCPDPAALQTLIRQTGVQVEPPTPR